jgi:co-chaperonin GroES (HSP10)
MECDRFFPLKRRGMPLFMVGILLGTLVCSQVGFAQAAASTPAQTADSAQRAVGAIKAIKDSSITLTSDAGDEVRVTLQESTRILRVAPGEKDLKNATPLQKTDLQVGDRVLVRGKSSGDAHSFAAGAVIVMKQADVAAKREQDRDDWQKRGVGGLVTAIDPATGTITISMTSFSGSKSVAVHTAKNTILRRYAANSVKFDDANVAPLDQIKVGDQLRARGTKNEDVSEVSADEVVSGTFRNLAGTVTQVDAAANTLTLKDVLSKQSVVVKVTNDAQLRKLPAEFAQRIAMRLKGAAAAGIPGAAAAMGGENANGGAARKQGTGNFPGGPPNGGMGGGMSGGRRPPDIQQILSRMPAASLADLQKGDAVMIVSTQGNASGEVNAITLLAGVEPILTASPGATQALMLSPWSLSSSGAEAAANP